MPKPVTVVHVARAAGVAVGTVSRVFNHHVNVNANARARVLKAAQDLGYKRIRQRRKNGGVAVAATKGNVGVIIFGMEDTLVHLPVVGAALHGVESALSLRGENLMLSNIPRGDLVPGYSTASDFRRAGTARSRLRAAPPRRPADAPACPPCQR